MSQNSIRASEISDILLEKLKGIDITPKYEEIGTVLSVSDGVARIYGLSNAEMASSLSSSPASRASS